jgi:glycosyltransferase involved in cell wall biosynthesis
MPKQKVKQLVIVAPVYNDWESFHELLMRLSTVAGTLEGVCLDVIAVDDGSTLSLSNSLLADGALANLGRIDVLHLACNLGHQRAIAIGLAEVDNRGDYAAAIVMDSDGEDRPEDIPQLLAALSENSGCIVVAQRARRSEGRVFKAFYVVYKVLFHFLTGQQITFGNFCVLPASLIGRLVYTPEIWNNLAAAITRSRLPVHHCPTDRGVRYAGQSKMNMVSLFIHGLSAVSVHSDIAFTRGLAISAGLGCVTLIGIGFVSGLRLFTDFAVPGWASNMVGFLLIMLVQALILSAGLVFLLLNNRSTPSIIPKKMAGEYVRDRTALRPT